MLMSMSASRQLSASLEDYLEVIFRIAASKGAARTTDIAKKLGVRAASVTGALQALAERKYIDYTPYEAVTLTSEGLEEAKKILRRHEILRCFFVKVLGIKEKIAEEGACKLEHDIPKPIADRLIEFMEFVESCPRGGRDWVEKFIEQCSVKKNKNCEACIEQKIKDFQKEKSMAKTSQEITLAALKPKEKGVVIKINRRGSVTKRLADMGIGRGALIEVERVAPLGDPIDIKVRGYHLSLRKAEAANIAVRLEQ
jgi:DtxR family Mn-dependent transcriptional regulator